ncbi:hypothetical protein HDU99_008227 [Rhizoclosmatium hyalinum]|nr:hypothetical protein HDU99_008227 [Rhizoclosmatium hyalinum]
MSASIKHQHHSVNVEDNALKDLRNHIFSQLVALEPLLDFASYEPRLEGRFQTSAYRSVISLMYELLDRLECVRLSVGEKPFDADVKKVLKSPRLAESRGRLQQVIRMLLYIFTSCMLTKLKILPGLPNVSVVREKVIHDFVAILLRHGGIGDLREVDVLEGVVPVDRKLMLETLNTEKWMRLFGTSAGVREVSRTVDKFVPYMKEIFGESPDIAEEEVEESEDDGESCVLLEKGKEGFTQDDEPELQTQLSSLSIAVSIDDETS